MRQKDAKVTMAMAVGNRSKMRTIPSTIRSETMLLTVDRGKHHQPTLHKGVHLLNTWNSDRAARQYPTYLT